MLISPPFGEKVTIGLNTDLCPGGYLLFGLAGGADDALAAALVVLHEVMQHCLGTARERKN